MKDKSKIRYLSGTWKPGENVDGFTSNVRWLQCPRCRVRQEVWGDAARLKYPVKCESCGNLFRVEENNV